MVLHAIWMDRWSDSISRSCLFMENSLFCICDETEVEREKRFDGMHLLRGCVRVVLQ